MIVPLALDPVALTLDVWHEERAHGGALLLSQVTFHRQPAGLTGDTEVLTHLDMPCPVVGCGSVSVHPAVGDGRCRPLLQRLFVRRLMARVVGRTWLQARAIHRVLVEQQDGGLTRWLLADVTDETG